MWVGRLQRIVVWLETAHPGWHAAAIAAVAIAFRAHVAQSYDFPSGFLVKGMPVSDAHMWDLMAAGFSRGERWDLIWGTLWDAHRPFYWMFAGSIYALTGPSLAVLRIVQLGLGVLACVLIFDLLRRAARAIVAVVVGLAAAVYLVDAQQALAPTTEPLGHFLAVAAVWCFVVGGAASERRLRWLAASGCLVALANLTRPQTLLAAGALPLVLVLLSWRRGGSRRRTALGVAAFVLAFVATLAPWMVRQRVKYGIWALSPNGAEMMFAATSRKFGVWKPEVSALGANARTVKERVELYDRLTWENLREDPGFFVKNAAGNLVALASDKLAPSRWVLLAASVAFALALASRRTAVRLALAWLAVAAGLLLLPDRLLCLTWVAGVALAVVRREPMAIVAAMLVSSAVMMAVAGAVNIPRFYYSMAWMAWALATWVVGEALRVAAQGSVPVGPGWTVVARPLRWAAGAGVLVLALGFGRAELAHLHPASPPAGVVTAEESRAWVDAVMRSPVGNAYAPLRERLEVRVRSFRPDYLVHLDAREAVRHWNPLFGVARAYPRTIFETWPCMCGTLVTSATGELFGAFPGGVAPSPRQELVMIGVPIARPSDGSSFEVVALAPANAAPSPEALIVPAAADAQAHAADVLAGR